MLSYLLPDIFTNASDFDSWCNSDDCLSGKVEMLKCLQAVLKPFLLRRVKAEVLPGLLPKKEMKLYVPMTPVQRDTYKQVLSKNIKSIRALGQISKISKKSIPHIVKELQKAANHPYLIDNIEQGPPYTTDQHLVDSCGKMLILDQLLAKLESRGSRVVLFSQFVVMLDIIDDYLTWKGYKFHRLDGNTPLDKRRSDIDSFNADGSEFFIYIISTRAGGLGNSCFDNFFRIHFSSH